MRIAFCFVLAMVCLTAVAYQMLYLATETTVDRSQIFWYLPSTVLLITVAGMALSYAEKLRWKHQRRRLMASPRTKK